MRKRPSVAFYPRTDKQSQYKDVLRGADPSIVVAVGPAGTAKTFGAVLVGLEKLAAGEVDRLVLTRPAVSADEELGFLPGNLEDKMSVWLLPIMDALRVHLSPSEIARLMAPAANGGGGQVEVCSLSHMRGRTFRNAYVVIDECQNTTPSQMLMLLTRIGEGSKFVFTGDPQQHDRKTATNSGLVDFIGRWQGIQEADKFDDDGFVQIARALTVFTFDRQDVQRHPAIPLILDMYDDAVDAV